MIINEWIRAKDKMPDNGERLLCYIQNRNYKWIQTGICDYTECEWFVDDNDLDAVELGEGEKVTHWMKMPDPPEINPPSLP